MPQEWEEGFKWLNQNAESGTIVCMNVNLSKMVLYYTKLDQVTTSCFPVTSMVTIRENARNISMVLKTLNISLEDFKKYFYYKHGDLGEKIMMNESGQFVSPFKVTNYWRVHLFHTLSESPTGDLSLVDPAWKMIEEEYKAAEPIKEPLYVWVNYTEKDLIKVKGQLVYQNGKIQIFKTHN